jgi:hypothetical protein
MEKVPNAVNDLKERALIFGKFSEAATKALDAVHLKLSIPKGFSILGYSAIDHCLEKYYGELDATKIQESIISAIDIAWMQGFSGSREAVEMFGEEFDKNLK